MRYDAPAGSERFAAPSPDFRLTRALAVAVSRPNTTHLPLRAEECVPTLQLLLGVRRASLICVDANVHPPRAVAFALAVAALASHDAVLVISEKRFAPSGDAHAADCGAAERMLRAAGFGDIQRRHLLSNGRVERTLLARRALQSTDVLTSST